MRLDSVRLAIRPRSVLECLDLAFLVCGQHFLGLSLAMVLGILPVYWFNGYVLQNLENPYLWMLVIGLELPLATLPITLFMGQIVFSKRFSTSQAMRAVGGSLLSYFFFQGIVRFFCLATIVLSPLVFVGMYYLNPIILLERPMLGKVWPRLWAMNRRNLGRILGLVLIDFLVLIAGNISLSLFLRGIAALWEDRFSWWQMMVQWLQGDGFHSGWQEQVAFWMIMSFLTVFRFITYIDCRIRREGWDVDLKIRAMAQSFSEKEVA